MGLNSIFGHEKQKNLLLSFLQNERLPHAFLFSGQEGIGKKKIAFEFIKHILCEKGNGCWYTPIFCSSSRGRRRLMMSLIPLRMGISLL
jgi:DNA polymerase III gamma/tau subunit